MPDTGTPELHFPLEELPVAGHHRTTMSDTRGPASDAIQEACKQIALQMMKIHPQVGKLDDAETQADILKAAHNLTVELETIKKKLIRLKGRDESREL